MTTLDDHGEKFLPPDCQNARQRFFNLRRRKHFLINLLFNKFFLANKSNQHCHF